MIEIRRDLYMDENTGERRATLADVAADTAIAIAAVRQTSRGRSLGASNQFRE